MRLSVAATAQELTDSPAVIVESHEFGKRDVHVDNVVPIPLDEPAQVALPSLRAWM
jgi:hypothetical protein